jgi:hypothetical protein
VKEVFAFFSDAGNLDVLTPPWLHFQVLTPSPVSMHPGAVIDYRLSWHGLRIHWRTVIVVWAPPHRFVDRQIKGPYRQWVHEHTFAERDSGTLMRDRVDYAVPGGPLAPLLQRWVVGPDVGRIFAFRRETMRELFTRATA